MKYRVCIVGHGFVGSALSKNVRPETDLVLVDPALDYPIERIEGQDFDVIFVCVPTPSNDDGTIDSSIVDSVINFIEKKLTPTLIVLKSTVTPDLVDFYCANPEVVYNPEFLTERNAVADFKNAPFHILGCRSIDNASFLEDVYRNAFDLNPDAQYVYTEPAEASFIKYGINSFLSTKVAWFNQLYDLVNVYNDELDFDRITYAMGLDSRIGITHMKVPGWDGNRGFGGACFPKDVPAFVNFSKNIGNDFTILKNAWNYNVDVRTKNGLLEREIQQNVTYRMIF